MFRNKLDHNPPATQHTLRLQTMLGYCIGKHCVYYTADYVGKEETVHEFRQSIRACMKVVIEKNGQFLYYSKEICDKKPTINKFFQFNFDKTAIAFHSLCFFYKTAIIV